MENTIYLRDGWVRIETWNDTAKFDFDELDSIKYMLDMYEDEFRVVSEDGWFETYTNSESIEDLLNEYYEEE